MAADSVTSYDVYPEHETVGGYLFTVRCPQCNHVVEVITGTGGIVTLESKCDCGYTWTVSLTATGTKNDNQ